MTQERVLVVTPARHASSRLPGKLLEDLGGAPLIVRTAERARAMTTATEVVVATDHDGIAAAVAAAGFACERTGEHATGTDRIGEVLGRREADLVVNLQGDEPLLDPVVVDRLVRDLQADSAADLATCAHPFGPHDRWEDPSCVKVLVDRRGRALYFSRAPVPGTFPGRAEGPAAARLAWRHVGLYVWRAAALRRVLAWPRGDLEQCEGLEQLRALENGLVIRVLPISEGPVGVDTPADLARVRALWPGRPGSGGDPTERSPEGNA